MEWDLPSSLNVNNNEVVSGCDKNRGYALVYEDKGRWAGPCLFGVTDDYIVQLKRTTRVVRVLDKHGADYGKIKKLLEKWSPTDLDVCKYLAGFHKMEKVLLNVQSHHLNKWMHFDKLGI